jgi:hypothetical protein
MLLAVKNRFSRFAIFFLGLFLSCQGPWSYYPEDPEKYQGIWITAYIVSGRSVENVCLEKMHNLNEVYLRGFAFYDAATIEITGTFDDARTLSEKDTSIFLIPDTDHFDYSNPNCFVGDRNLRAKAGESYEMNVSVVWDSAGKKTTSSFSAETRIPKKFKIKRAYDLLGNIFNEKDTISYLPPPMDMRSNYFIPEYSDDVGGALVAMIYRDMDELYWGENFIDKIAEKFDPNGDTARHARFGDRRLVYTASNMQIANMNKDIDSIPVLGFVLPAIGNIKLLFYATTREYIEYLNTFLQGTGDSRIKPVYNINGGAGIFAGMMVDTFEVNLKTTKNVGVYSYHNAQSAYCRTMERDSNKDQYKTRRECIEIWDEIIWCEIDHGKPESNDEVCLYKDYYEDERLWYDIPSDELKKVLDMDDLITWCGHRDFPIKRYALCGQALAHFFNSGKKSPILEREVKKWCQENKNDEECRSFLNS